MGSLHDAFVPAAILLDNPGITLEGFDELLRSVGPFYKPSDAIFGRNSLILNPNPYRTGIHSILKDIFYMDSNLTDIQPCPNDRFRISPLQVIPKQGVDRWLTPKYEVNTYLGITLGEPEIRQGADYGDYKKGKEIVWGLDNNTYFYLNGELKVEGGETLRRNTFRIEEILSRTIKQVQEQQVPQAKLLLRRSIPKYKQETFETLKELVESYPKFSPEKLFNLKQEAGDLSIGQPFNLKARWYKRGQGYYLDTKQLLERKEDYREWITPDFIYTSIVLTAEAIKHKEWEMMAWASGDERPGILAQFLMAHPDSKRRHDNQLIQFWDSRNAIDLGLTQSEWLELRGLEQWRRGLTDEQAKVEFQLICDDAPEQIKRMNARREYEAKPAGPIKKEKFPF